MRIKKWVIGFLVLLFGFIPASGLVFENGILDLPEIAANLYARENCMCIFISGFDQKQCEEITSQLIPVSELKIHPTEKSVQARVFWAHSQFRVKNAELGCTIY